LPVDLAMTLVEVVGGRVINMYGPTETTVWSSAYVVRGTETGTIPIGRPVANTSFHVLAPDLTPVPIGIAGELCIGGAGVALGYLGAPELTAGRFTAIGYRTGDLVRLRADGVVEFLGRIDRQIKIRGHRIEPAEIEAVLGAHPGVAAAAVTVRTDGNGEAFLVAHVSGADGAAPDAASLRAHAERLLPPVMVPSVFITIDALPLMPNGKLDRAALPWPVHNAGAASAVHGPVSSLEEKLLEIWRDVLGRADAGPTDNFFDLGGHSLLAVRVHERLCSALGSEVPLTELFQYPTVRSLASALERAHRDSVATDVSLRRDARWRAQMRHAASSR
jgi:acyl carrier protein